MKASRFTEAQMAFVGLWAIARWSRSTKVGLAAAVAVVNGAFLVRRFMIQHDCGHGSFFRSRAISDWIGRGLGVRRRCRVLGSAERQSYRPNGRSRNRLPPFTLARSASEWSGMWASTIAGAPPPQTRRSGPKASMTVRVKPLRSS